MRQKKKYILVVWININETLLNEKKLQKYWNQKEMPLEKVNMFSNFYFWNFDYFGGRWQQKLK